MKQEEKWNNRKFDEFIMKVNVKCFGFKKNLLQEFKFLKKSIVKIWMK